MPDLLMPAALKVVNEWLKAQTAITDICGKRISPKLDTVLPAIRLTNVGPIERGPEEALQRIQVECWAASYDDAEKLANTVVSVLPEARGQWTSGYCAGGAVESGPFDSPDLESEKYRQQLDLALWLYPNSP
jgi:hypothetical protein